MKLCDILKTQNNMDFLKLELEYRNLKVNSSNFSINFGVSNYLIKLDNGWQIKLIYSSNQIRHLLLSLGTSEYDFTKRFLGQNLDLKKIKTICSYCDDFICSYKP